MENLAFLSPSFSLATGLNIHCWKNFTLILKKKMPLVQTQDERREQNSWQWGSFRTPWHLRAHFHETVQSPLQLLWREKVWAKPWALGL